MAIEEVARLLDQCTPEELSDILREIEGASTASLSFQNMPPTPPQAKMWEQQRPQELFAAATANPIQADSLATVAPTIAAAAASPPVPVAPSAPPPGGRRPQLATLQPAAGTPPSGQAVPVTLNQLRGLLQDHGASVLTEVHQLLQQRALSLAGGLAPPPSSEGTVDMTMIASTLVERDREVQQLEAQLAGLQAELARKDRPTMQTTNKGNN